MATRYSCSDVKNKLPPASDAGVSNADKFSPVRSCEPQLPQEYSYSYYSEEESEEEQCTSEDEVDSTPEPNKHLEDRFRFLRDHPVFDLPAPTEKKKCLIQDEVLHYTCSTNIRSRKNRFKVNRWVDTWKELDGDGLIHGEPSWTWIHVYAYYSKKKRHGGYGVILRNALGKPIIAAAKFSKTGVSFYYQVFKGINVGVTLAKARNLSDLRVACNSITVPEFFYTLSNCSDDRCKIADGRSDICKSCYLQFVLEGCEVVVPLVLALRHENLKEIKSSRKLAQHYVAKMEKKKILESSATSDDGFVLSPGDFPRGLKNILWAESFHMKSMDLLWAKSFPMRSMVMKK